MTCRIKFLRGTKLGVLLAVLAGGGAGVGLASGVAAQSYAGLAHPYPPPQAEQFQQPPEVDGISWVGPFINVVGDASCWYVKPDSPEIPVGGEHGTQSVVGFVHLPPDLLSQRDTSFTQPVNWLLSGGGAELSLQPGDIPAGFFLAIKAHPIYKITKVELVSKMILFPGPVLAVHADFIHEPAMGECYFYLAAWVAR